MEVTKKLSELISQTEYRDLPDKAIEMAKLCLLDWLGVTLMGSREPSSKIILKLIRELGGRKQSTIIGIGHKTSALNAALVNGTFSHALDYDDVHRGMIGHPSAPLIPALLAVGEWKRLNGKTIIASIVLGYEIEAKIGTAINPDHAKSGWHPTATLGNLAAAAGVGKLLDLDPGRIAYAMGIAATQAFGMRKVFGTMCKPFHAGKAAMNGVMAALLAEKNFSSPLDMIEGDKGFLDIFCGKSNLKGRFRNMGIEYEILKNGFKIHASCGFTHSAIDAAIKLRNDFGIKSNDIREILCFVPSLAAETAYIDSPQTGMEGKFSLKFCIALGIEKGRASEDMFSSTMVNDTRVRALMNKTNIIADDSLKYSEAAPARLLLKMRNGSEQECRVDLPKGRCENPLSREELSDKFRRLSQSILPEEKIDKVVEMVNDFENVGDISELMPFCC